MKRGLSERFQLLSLPGFGEKFKRSPLRADAYYVLWVDEGAGSLQLDYFTHTLRPGMLLLINEGRVVQASLDQAAGRVLFFTEQFLPLSGEGARHGLEQVLYNYFCHSPFVHLDSARRGRLGQTLLDLEEEYGRQDPQEELLRAYLKVLLLHYQRLIKEDAQAPVESGRYARIIALRQDIEQYFKRHREAAFYAQRQAITPKQLNKISQLALGKTVTELVHERLLLEAKRMLHFTDRSAKEIAYELGFADPAYFFRFFKREARHTPEDFRRQVQSAA
ncbi:MAG TPA: helix-turn-helix domain-containing protein [Cytophagales bacterium]|jgi:AraC-like DNA-binding protein